MKRLCRFSSAGRRTLNGAGRCPATNLKLVVCCADENFLSVMVACTTFRLTSQNYTCVLLMPPGRLQFVASASSSWGIGTPPNTLWHLSRPTNAPSYNYNSIRWAVLAQTISVTDGQTRRWQTGKDDASLHLHCASKKINLDVKLACSLLSTITIQYNHEHTVTGSLVWFLLQTYKNISGLMAYK